MKDEPVHLQPSSLMADPADFVRRAPEVLLVASFGQPVAADFAARYPPGSWEHPRAEYRVLFTDLSKPAALGEFQSSIVSARVKTVILFVKPILNEADRAVLEALLEIIGERHVKFFGIVSTFAAHLGDEQSRQTEDLVLSRVKMLSKRVVIFRPGHILSNHSRMTRFLRRLGIFYPLIPARFRGCCVGADELIAAIEKERHVGQAFQPAEPKAGWKACPSGTRQHTAQQITLLGPNRPWRDWLREHRTRGPISVCLTFLCSLLAWLLVGQLFGLALSLLMCCRPSLRRWSFDTLRPRNFGELLALCNPHNNRHVKVVGYNNGVVHFGHRYPGQTVVSTVHCNRVRRTGADEIKADCGTTIRKAMDFLTGAEQELHVIPNFSYVCLGTAFFVPIHGSASDFTTVAETITRVLLYDPTGDRLILASSADPAFQDGVYNMQANLLVLRVWLKVKAKARYFVHKQTLENPGSDELLSALQDKRAANVEIRKSNASSSRVDISQYFKTASDSSAPVLEIPRDSLGRLWDRLEENPVTRFLMHALTRWFAWHVELFFTAEEFATFWKTHTTLPLEKIQLRYIRRDGLPHSPFRDHDCVSVDMFMLRRQREVFEKYLRETFAVVRSNPGKHSR